MRIEPKSEFNLFVVPSLDRQDRFGTNFGYRNFIWALVIALDYRNDIGLFAPGRRVATSKGLGSRNSGRRPGASGPSWRRPGVACIEDVPERLLAARDGLSRIDSQAILDPALARMRPRERQLLWLAHAEGYSHREISEITGLLSEPYFR